MKKKIKFLLLIVVLITINHVYSHFFGIEILEGDYYNTNFVNSSLAEVARYPDTLKLLNNYTFSSEFYGKGIFELKQTILGTRITFYYNGGTSIFKTILSREWFGKPRIIISDDTKQYYIKQ